MSLDTTPDSLLQAIDTDIRPFSVTFESTGAHAGWEFPCEGAHSRPHIFWAIRLAAGNRINLSSGVALEDLSGCASVCARDPLHGTMARRDDERYMRGTMDYHRTGADKYDYSLGLQVSPRLFERLQRWIESGRQPRLEITLPDPDGGNASAQSLHLQNPHDYDSVLEWDNLNHPRLEVSGCNFKIELELPTSLHQHEGSNAQRPSVGLGSRTKIDLVTTESANTEDRVDHIRREICRPLWIIVVLLALVLLHQWFGH